MIDIIENLNKKFDNKYKNLKLLNVMYDSFGCTITFLFPYTIDEIDSQSRNEIENYLQEFLSLNKSIKVKFKKSFLDEKLIINEVIEFFKINKKGLLPYISFDNITSTYKDLDVDVKIYLNQDILSLLDDIELKSEIKEFLNKFFIANFNIEIIENEDRLPENIEADDIIPISSKARRYNVNVIKHIVGGDIIPKPEYIEDIKKPKTSVILSGFLTNKNKKTFIIKKGKHAGEEKSFYTFNLKNNNATIDCIYFCGKTHEKDMDILDDLSLLLCVGDVKFGLNGKLTYYIKKISLASPCEITEEIKNKDDIIYKHKKVVFPDLLPRSAQTNLFDEKQNYNEFIMNNNIVVFDIETTGLDPDTCEITEIGAVKVEHGEVTERFSSFAKPKNPIPLEVQELTHITDEMVAFAPRIEDVIQDFYEWSKGCILSGYNIINFDLKFIKKVANNIGLKFDNEVVDTMIVVRQSNLRIGNYKLGTVVKALGLTLNDAHRAFNDAYATAQVLMELNKK